MDDTEIVNWIGEHLVGFRECAHELYELSFLNFSGHTIEVLGSNIRECVIKAKQEYFN